MRLVAGLRLDPLASYSAPPDPLAVIRGEGKERNGGEGKGREGSVILELLQNKTVRFLLTQPTTDNN